MVCPFASATLPAFNWAPIFGEALSIAFESDGVVAVCDAYAVTPAADLDDKPITSDIPAVVFAGAFDPVTPPHWSRQVADALENASYVELPDHGHGMSTSCPASVRLAFLIDPEAPLDLSCVEATTGPAFE